MYVQTDAPRRKTVVDLAETKDVPPGTAKVFQAGRRSLAVFNIEGTFYAIDDTCTHWAGPLAEGKVQGTTVICPWHGAAFDLKTGAALTSPAQKPVCSYPVVVEGDTIKVELPE